MVLPVRPGAGGPGQEAEGNSGELGEEAPRRCAPPPGANEGATAVDLVEPDRHPRAKRADEAGGEAGFGLGEGPGPGVFRRSRLSARPPPGGEVAVEVDPVTVQPARRGAAIGVEIGDDEDVGSRLRAAAP